MKKFQWPLRAFLFICLIQINSCTKSVDKITNDSVTLESSSNATVANEFSTCKLRKIIHEADYWGEILTGLFTYNSAGNPISLTYASGSVYNHYFIYDTKGRLKEYRKRYSPDDPVEEERHVYGYDGNNRIVADSLRNDWGGVYMVSTLTYDSLGRIIAERIVWPGHTTRNPTYTYDARGNLAVKGWKSSGYDNKVSIFRAHPIFQFIHRNYSRNNALPEAKYNSKGLPLAVKNLNDGFFGAFPIDPAAVDPHGGIEKAMYDCQ